MQYFAGDRLTVFLSSGCRLSVKKSRRLSLRDFFARCLCGIQMRRRELNLAGASFFMMQSFVQAFLLRILIFVALESFVFFRARRHLLRL